MNYGRWLCLMGDAVLTAGGGCSVFLLSESLPKTKLEARRLFPLEGTVEPVSQSAVPIIVCLWVTVPFLLSVFMFSQTIHNCALPDDTRFCSVARKPRPMVTALGFSILSSHLNAWYTSQFLSQSILNLNAHGAMAAKLCTHLNVEQRLLWNNLC